MEDLTYVTGNYGKYIAVKEAFENSEININYFKCDLNEPEVNDIIFISKEKARKAYEIINSPVFVADSGFYIENYPNNPGYPGAFVKRSGISSNIQDLLTTMKDITDRNCYFLDCLTFFDGYEYYQFFGKNEGTLSYEIKGHNDSKNKSNLWYIFIPINSNKTLSEMTDEERKMINNNTENATNNFIRWYKYDYNKVKKLIKH